MKTLTNLTFILLLLGSFNSFASDDRHSAKLNGLAKQLQSSSITAAGAPAVLSDKLKALKNRLTVPVSPFTFGSADEAIAIGSALMNSKSMVPVAPFELGSPDELPEESLSRIIAVNADVPVAPFDFGDPATLPLFD